MTTVVIPVASKASINGDEQLQYGVLRDYAQMISTIDKGSRVIL